MIVYENPDHQFSSTGYDATYAADPRHFTHRSTFEALDTLFTEHLEIDRPLWCLRSEERRVGKECRSRLSASH